VPFADDLKQLNRPGFPRSEMRLIDQTLRMFTEPVLGLGGLGFLGLGLPETIPEWGGDLQQALTAVPTGIWWTALYPGLAMFVLVLGLSFLGEGLEDWLSGQTQRSS
jgi:ABC-type dipeptide/oligopeptide/nickel transport system permease subunit